MSGAITIPILKDKFNSNEQIGVLTIEKDALPNTPNFVFSIAYQTEENSKYELKAVSIISDKEFLKYLEEQND